MQCLPCRGPAHRRRAGLLAERNFRRYYAGYMLDPDGLRAFLATTLTSVPRRSNWLAELGRRVFSSLGVRETSSGIDEVIDGKVEGFEGNDVDAEAEHNQERRKEARR